MCYLKNLADEFSLDFDQLFHKPEEQTQEQCPPEVNILVPCVQKWAKQEWSHQQQMLVKLFQMMEKNNMAIRSMQQCLVQPSDYFENSSAEIRNQPFDRVWEKLNNKLDSASQPHFGGPEYICLQLFGHHRYKYSLQLESDFPTIIYKQRNFNLSVKLVDSSNKPVRNFNFLNLCCAVCTSEAEWIHQNRVGEPFLKGKTEVQLYKGEASFMKLYARDVSRIYPGGRVYIVIYAKPSTLLCPGANSLEVQVNSDEVRPLLIEDVQIKAKKKQ